MADLDSEVQIISVGQDELNDDFRKIHGLSTHSEKDESMSISCVSMDKHFGIEADHYENFPEDDIGKKAPEDSVEKLVEHLVDQMTAIDVKDINTILETSVPGAVSKEVARLIDSLEPLLLKAWEVTKNHTESKSVEQTEETNVDSTQSHKQEPVVESDNNHVIPTSFYRALKTLIHNESRGRSSGLPPVKMSLYDICNMSILQKLNSEIYQNAWKGFISDLLKALVKKPDGTSPTEHEAMIRESGRCEVGFQVDCSVRGATSYCPVLHSKPDALLIMEGNFNLPDVQCVSHTLCMRIPVLAVEIKTSYAETASYNGECMAEEFSPFTSETSRSSSLMDVDNSLTEAPTMPQRMVFRPALGASAASPNAPGGDMMGDHVTSGGVSILAKKQMAKMKKQHVVQLIGMYKWTISIIRDALSKINQVEGLANYRLKTRNIGSLGLFVMQNRVYFTRLSIPNLSESDPARSPSLVILNWAMQSRLAADVSSSYPTTFGCPPKVKISDVYLDILNPNHLRAFLMFLRIALWGEFHVYA